MNWQQGEPTSKGLYLCRTVEGFGESEVGYQVIFWDSFWTKRPIVTHWVHINEPVENEYGVYRDPLGRLNIAAANQRGVNRYNIGPGMSK